MVAAFVIDCGNPPKGQRLRQLQVFPVKPKSCAFFRAGPKGKETMFLVHNESASSMVDVEKLECVMDTAAGTGKPATSGGWTIYHLEGMSANTTTSGAYGTMPAVDVELVQGRQLPVLACISDYPLTVFDGEEVYVVIGAINEERAKMVCEHIASDKHHAGGILRARLMWDYEVHSYIGVSHAEQP